MKYCIFVRGKKVSVSEEVYKGYWKLVNHQKYLNRKDRKFGVLPFSSLEVDGLPLANVLPDTTVDIERLVETKLVIEQLNEALLTLSDKEFEIIDALYFREHTIREVAIEHEMSSTSLFRMRNTILDNLRKFFEK
ncbi:sigma-70 family RNA polymerase sigma factor [Streptococcus suis]|uniref:sigma-70 family RNA polymerase sigma factor n=1 Tax=Streptococcus suis TaxID=1307 RepID=UPI001EE9267B|nr:sigma-70 family RNA polymerase sigma factor [Streptococcus suis]MBS8087623.1 sigma-70 family RNA polymerase sigma factor [Streptococcus suis]MCH1563842.1 sigma-70 family RNA polymerase sigma factor [Streptococcus suis]MCH1628249.1 sigma-70 family RNA polymerase sigma factor [Streptococcus suis]HEM6496184.1 sigma-70 family RNA polymerase sigma factor [Streptococcus suis]